MAVQAGVWQGSAVQCRGLRRGHSALRPVRPYSDSAMAVPSCCNQQMLDEDKHAAGSRCRSQVWDGQVLALPWP